MIKLHLVLGLVAATVYQTLAQTCAPASPCPPLSMECMPCNPRTQESCTPDNLALFESGMCTEPRWLNSRRLIFGQRIQNRCRAIVDYAWAVQSPRPGGKQYVKQCRQGEYTCNSGRCVRWRKLPKACYKGMIDSPSEPNHPCNLANEAFRQELEELWELQVEEGHSYCTLAGDDGIRFFPLRCDTRISTLGIASSCPTEQAVKPQNCYESTFVNELLGPADACSDTCAHALDLEMIPGCCTNPDQPVCTRMQVRSPQEPLPRCSAGRMEEGCRDCLDLDNAQPGGNAYPFCCKSNTGALTCANKDGLDINGSPNACGPTGSDLGELCYVDSAGSEANTIPEADDGSAPSGTVLTFKMDLVDDTLSPDGGNVGDCCCAVVCACFGDPHCTSFFGDYEYTQASTGLFTMINVNGFDLTVENGFPLGVIAHAHITHPDVPGTTVISADGCVSGADEAALQAMGFPFHYQGRTQPNTSGMPDNEYKALFPVFIEVFFGDYTVELKCVRFNMGSGRSDDWHSRLDVTVKRSTSGLTVEGILADTCCPSNDQAFAALNQYEGATGYCMRHPNVPGSFISAAMAENHSLRRLEPVPYSPPRHLREVRMLTESADEVAESLYSMYMNNFNSLDDLDTVELVKLYQKVTGATREQAVGDLIDLGEEGLRVVIEAALANCYEFASDPVFDYANRNPCTQGLTLEARLLGESTWTPLKFFPANLVYCNDMIKVIDQHTSVDDQGHTLTPQHELRLSHCTISRENCPTHDFCQPSMSVRDLGVVKTMYGSMLTDSLMKFADVGFERCKCHADPIACVKECVLHANCPTEPCTTG